MSTVAEIERALEQLPSADMLAVAEWLDEQRLMLTSAESTFLQMDAEEGGDAGSQWQE